MIIARDNNFTIYNRRQCAFFFHIESITIGQCTISTYDAKFIWIDAKRICMIYGGYEQYIYNKQ